MSQSAHKHLLQGSADSAPSLRGLLVRNGPITLTRRKATLFEFLVKTVISQQLSTEAANTIWKRLVLAAKNSGLSIYCFVHEGHLEVIRGCGISKNKSQAILVAKNSIASKAISGRKLRTSSHESVIRSVSALWGFGDWSAEMVALSYCGLPNVWSDKDASLNKGLSLICQRDIVEPSAVLDLADPYRSYLALHVWKGLDDGYLQ